MKSVAAAAIVDYNQSDVTDAFHTWNGGLEGHLTYEDIVRVAARCGYYYDPLGNIQDFTFGTGIRAWMVAFDAGWIPQARDSGLDRVLKITAGIHADLSGPRPKWPMN